MYLKRGGEVDFFCFLQTQSNEWNVGSFAAKKHKMAKKTKHHYCSYIIHVFTTQSLRSIV